MRDKDKVMKEKKTLLVQDHTYGRFGRILNVIVLMCLCLAFPLCIQVGGERISAAEEEEQAPVYACGDYQYKMLEDGTAEICGYTGAGGNITVPAVVDGNAVSRIGEYVFSDNMTITAVTIEDGIKVLGRSCFYGCSNIVSFGMPDSVTDMEYGVCSLNESLKTIRLSKNLTHIGACCFSWCEALVLTEIPDKVIQIDEFAFSDCYSIREIYLPDGLQVLEMGVFERCSNLERIRISPKTNIIGNSAFAQNSKLSWLTNVDWRDLSISNLKPKISIISKEPYIHIDVYAFEDALTNCSIVTNRNLILIKDNAFSTSTTLYGKVGTNIQDYASANGNPFYEYIELQKIQFTKEKVALEWNGRNMEQLTYGVIPSNATVTQVGYRSSNPKVATVDGEGKVTALSEGTTEITAVSLEDERITATCQVEVSTALEKINLSNTTLTMYPGENNRTQLLTSMIPSNASNCTLNWSSSNTSIATVDQTGYVTAFRPGLVTITVSCGVHSVNCQITVLPGKVEGFKMKGQTTSSISLSWKKVKDIDGYTLYGYNTKTKKYTKLTDLKASKTNYIVKKYIGRKRLLAGTGYRFSIKAYKCIGKNKYYGEGMWLQTVTKPSKVSVRKLQRIVNKSKTAWKLSWKKTKGASGYQVSVSVDKGRSYRKLAILQSGKKTSYSYWISNKKRKSTTYYVKVKAYTTVGKKRIYGANSKVWSITIY